MTIIPGDKNKIIRRRTSAEIALEMANNLIADNKYSEAIKLLETKSKRVKNKTLLYKKLVELYKNQKMYDSAIRILKQAVETDPQNIHLKEMLLETFLELSRFDDAITESRELLRISPRNLSARDVLYFSYLHKGMLEKALQVTNELITLDPASPVNHYKKAFVHHEKGDIGAAIHELSRVLEMGPDEEMAEEVQDALEKLDTHQIQHIIMLAIEDFIFRTKLIRDPEAAALERGYYLSFSGMSMLKQIQFDELPEIYTDWKQRYYH
ncbi:MAG: tetratricopeptide repeat protein [Armatimonadota bacterium]